MDKEIRSITHLREFVEKKGLNTDWYNTIKFPAHVLFQMEDSTKECNLDVHIIFQDGDNAGVVKFYGENFDPRMYPMGHLAKFQNYKFIKGTSLEITKGKNFGDYRIVVTPI